MELGISLREAIYDRVRGKTEPELTKIIVDSIGHDEKALPGIGVLFELIWYNCDDTMKTNLIQVLKDHIPSEI